MSESSHAAYRDRLEALASGEAVAGVLDRARRVDAAFASLRSVPVAVRHARRRGGRSAAGDREGRGVRGPPGGRSAGGGRGRTGRRLGCGSHDCPRIPRCPRSARCSQSPGARRSWCATTRSAAAPYGATAMAARASARSSRTAGAVPSTGRRWRSAARAGSDSPFPCRIASTLPRARSGSAGSRARR